MSCSDWFGTMLQQTGQLLDFGRTDRARIDAEYDDFLS